MMVISQVMMALAIFGLAFVESKIALGALLCLAGAATASLSLNLYAIAQIFAGPRIAGTWIGIQNALGNLSGILGPIITGMIIDRTGYGSAFVVTAAVGVAGAIWWLVAVPRIAPIVLD